MSAQSPTHTSHRATRASIDLNALAHNLAIIRSYVGTTPAIMAVVKANAYGHGAIRIARAALDAGATALAVATVDEGAALRHAVKAPILVFAPSVVDEFESAIESRLTLAIGSLADAQALSAVATRIGRTANVHLEIDTGMHRFGFPSTEVDSIARVASLPGVLVEGLYTHFVSSESSDATLAQEQLSEFRKVVGLIESRGLKIPVRHASNSGSVFQVADGHLSLVRPGLAMYGYDPRGSDTADIGLKPVLRLTSKIVRLEDVADSTGVSYNHTFVATKPTRLGLVPIGYADGLPRALSNKGWMLVGGHRCPIVGRICMDQTVIDVTKVPNISLGDEVVIIGTQETERISVMDLATLTDTIPYEILTGLSTRIPRDYVS